MVYDALLFIEHTQVCNACTFFSKYVPPNEHACYFRAGERQWRQIKMPLRTCMYV